MTRRPDLPLRGPGRESVAAPGTRPSGDTLHGVQDAFAAHLRDPEGHPAPPGIDPHRMQVYRNLFFDNIDRLLAGNFPVIRRIYGGRWPGLVRAFYAGHGCRTPVFPELPREFLRWLEDSGGREPWLPELAHYEWVELALQISTARLDDGTYDALDGADCSVDTALLERPPRLSPLAWPLAYAWPVHRIAPDFQPDAPPASPTLLLLHRGADGVVRFHAPSTLAWRLLQRLEQAPECTGRAQLDALAMEAGTRADDAFIAAGLDMLVQWHREGIVAGVRR